MRSAFVLAASVVVFFSLAQPASAQPRAERRSAADIRQPLGADARNLVDAIPNEGTPRPRLHYFRSNEWRQDLLRPHLAGLGGAYVGVGSDQNYTMAAMAGSELLLLVDYDPLIPWVHEIYRVLVSASATPDELIARFAQENRAATAQLLREGLAGHRQAEQIARHWERRRDPWFHYLRRVQGLVRDGQPFSWLASQELYEHVRTLHRSGRIVSRNGDVTAERTVRAVGDAARQLGVPVRVVYFSNAEQFFPYSDGFIANMRALPTDERSVVVRTIRHRSIPNAVDGRWHYVVHSFPDFLERLDTGYYRRSFAFVSDLLAAGAPHLGLEAGISTITRETPRAMLEELRQARAERRSRDRN